MSISAPPPRGSPALMRSRVGRAAAATRSRVHLSLPTRTCSSRQPVGLRLQAPRSAERRRNCRRRRRSGRGRPCRPRAAPQVPPCGGLPFHPRPLRRRRRAPGERPLSASWAAWDDAPRQLRRAEALTPADPPAPSQQAVLEAAGVPFVGSSSVAAARAFNKASSAACLAAAGFPALPQACETARARCGGVRRPA